MELRNCDRRAGIILTCAKAIEMHTWRGHDIW